MNSPLRRIGLACLRAAVATAAGLVLGQIPAAVGVDPDAARRAILLTAVGAAVGCAAAGFQIHPRRSLGLVPLAATGLCVFLFTAALSAAPWSGAFCLTLGFFAGVAAAALRAIVLALVGRPLPAMPVDAAAAGLVLFPLALIENSVLAPAGWWYDVLAGVTGLAAVVAWILLAVPTLELFVECLIWPMYDIRPHGPGAARIPWRGPLLILSNHTSYADPFWLCVIVPRKVIPMMTSAFYDLPGIRWMMVHVVGAIRVQAAAFRREAPELGEAIAVLRRGGCLLLFPEGGLRKREEQLLAPFGQGVWHILRALPQTPVVVCWTEGGWGSFASYRGGPPIKDKSLDWRRRIDVAVAEPRVLDPAVLADHRTTRAVLRRACLECRRMLGLPVPEDAEKREGTQDEQGRDEAPESDAHQINP